MHDPDVEFGRIGNHAEVLLENVRVPRGNLIGPQGHGFVLSQVRLGPGRLHHATRWLAEAERAFDMMCERAQSRSSFGKSYTRHLMVQEYIADSVSSWRRRNSHPAAAWKFDRDGSRARAQRYRDVQGVQREGGAQRGGPGVAGARIPGLRR
jgi:acyl-CoA dehydrogenase